MAETLYEQFGPVYDDENRAQFKEIFNPEAPTGVSGWVPYTGPLPALRFADAAPFSLLGLQVWKAASVLKASTDRLWPAVVEP